MKSVEQRLQALEKDSHVPFDFNHLIARLAKLERQVRRLKAKKKAKL